MDGYPAGSLDHNVPYVIVSGFNLSPSELPLSKELQDQAILFRSEQPPLETREAKVLQTYLGEVDQEGRSWTGVSREEPFKLRIKNAGRVCRPPLLSLRRELFYMIHLLILCPVIPSTTTPSSFARNDGTTRLSWGLTLAFLAP
jgi:trafficking protein particle complex subunit 11